jgi:glycosyltransferase involved in cell wall biosynthesis
MLKISIVIPLHNAENFISQAFNNIEKQIKLKNKKFQLFMFVFLIIEKTPFFDNKKLN